ncbi:MAG: formylglycine-generating enzyme family protein [Hyphomicrobiaceae bacterium]
MHLLAAFTVLDWLAVASLVVLVVLIMIADSGAMQHLRRPIAATMLLLGTMVAVVVATTNPGDSLLFGQFVANAKSEPKAARGRAALGLGDGREAGRDASGPGDGDGGDSGEAYLALNSARTPAAGTPQPGGQTKGNRGTGAMPHGAGLSGDDQVGAGANRRDCERCPVMVQIPKGSLEVGLPRDPLAPSAAAGSLTHVTLANNFWLGRSEVTRAEFAYFLAESGYRPHRGCVVRNRFRRDYNFHFNGLEQTGEHPAVCVSWVDAKAYVAWLSQKTGRAYRLPSEAEWEYAAMARATTTFPWGNEITSGHANFGEVLLGTTPVNRYGQNGFGIYGMAGNAWELVEDCFVADRRGTPGDGRAVDRAGCEQRVMKGGAWYSVAAHLRPSARWANPAGTGGNGVGFRVARDVVANPTVAALSPPPAD